MEPVEAFGIGKQRRVALGTHGGYNIGGGAVGRSFRIALGGQELRELRRERLAGGVKPLRHGSPPGTVRPSR